MDVTETPDEYAWMQHGRCRGAKPTEFFPSDGMGVEIAQRVCDGCPVRIECLEYALPVGEAWVFERGGVVYTCVGDASAEELAALADDVSQPDESRVERLAEMVVDPFRW